MTAVPIDVERALAKLACDRTHGAAELAALGLEILAKVAEIAARDGAPMLAATRAVARRLSVARPSMAAIGNWSAEFVAALAARRAEPAPWAGALEAMARLRAAVAEGQLAAARTALAGADAVLTLSYSSTVCRVLGEPGAPRRVVVAESRPLLEGRALIEALHAPERDLTCITDAAIPYFAGRVSAVLLGADMVCRDASAVNKIGSLSAALGARHAGIPCFVVADRFKLNPSLSSAEIVLEEMAGEEIWPERASLCRNPYFEPVPASLITAFIVESGVLGPDSLAPMFAAAQTRLRQLDEP